MKCSNMLRDVDVHVDETYMTAEYKFRKLMIIHLFTELFHKDC